MNPQKSATDRELDQFYGTPPTEAQVQESIRRFTDAFDADDLAAIAYSKDVAILAALKAKDFEHIGLMFDNCRREEIANLVSMELYGKYGVITSKNIK